MYNPIFFPKSAVGNIAEYNLLHQQAIAKSEESNLLAHKSQLLFLESRLAFLHSSICFYKEKVESLKNEHDNLSCKHLDKDVQSLLQTEFQCYEKLEKLANRDAQIINHTYQICIKDYMIGNLCLENAKSLHSLYQTQTDKPST